MMWSLYLDLMFGILVFLHKSATAQGVAVDDTDVYANSIPHFSPLETILKSSSFKGH